MSNYSVGRIVQLASLSRVELIHDVDPEAKYIGRWYLVHLEPLEQNIVQTIEVTVTFSEFEEFLVANGWTVEPHEIRHIHNILDRMIPADHPVVTWKEGDIFDPWELLN